MRDILFKAKRIDNGEWVEGYLVRFCNRYGGLGFEIIAEAGIYYDGSPNYISHEVDESTICQFTGLLDKNGQKVWENEIIRELDGGMDGISRKVCWDEIYMMWKFPLVRKHWAYGYNEIDLWMMLSKNIEVIGNVFDNPELLKGGE